MNRWKLWDVCELLCVKVFVALYSRCFLMKATNVGRKNNNNNNVLVVVVNVWSEDYGF